MNIYFITGNKNKLREAEQILETKIKHKDIDVDEIQEMDPFKVADHKVKQAWKHVKAPLFVLDTSVYIDCLNGFPGPLIKWFWETVTVEKIAAMAKQFKNKKIMMQVIITYFDGKNIKYFEGKVKGTIPEKPRGNKGWGWDAIFIPSGYDKTYSEMEPQEVIHLRAHTPALKKLKEYLKS